MAQDAIDAAVKNAGLSTAQPCSTTGLRLVGGHGFNDALFTEVAQSYVVPHRPGAIDTRVAKHLACELPKLCDGFTHSKIGRPSLPEQDVPSALHYRRLSIPISFGGIPVHPCFATSCCAPPCPIPLPWHTTFWTSGHGKREGCAIVCLNGTASNLAFRYL